MQMLKKVGLVLSAAAPAVVLAAPPDFAPITAAIDLSTVSGVIMSVAAIMAGIYVVWKGAKFALGALRGL